MAERVESLGHFEMLWDCDHCGTTALLAKAQRHCAECGAPQNPDKRYFPEEGAERRVDGHQYEGADRHCPACNTPQSAVGQNCTRCGAPLDGSRLVRGIAAAAPPAPRARRWWLVAVILGALVLVGVGIWYQFFRTREAQQTITGHRWERAIAVETFAAVDGAAWRDQLPADARMPSCHRKQRSTRQVDTGEERCRVEKRDNRDGTFEQVKKCTPIYRDEPVDDDWCRYTAHRWIAAGAVKLAGAGLSPAWPTADLPPAQAAAVLGARRQGTRTERLILDLGGQACDVAEATWRKHADGARVTVEVRASSGKIVCASL